MIGQYATDLVHQGIEYCIEKQVFTVADLNSIIEDIKSKNKQEDNLVETLFGKMSRTFLSHIAVL